MTLNSSGPISLAGTTAGVSIEIENGGNGTTQISLNDSAVRTLAGVPSGAIIMPTNFYGKSNRVSISYTFTTSTVNASLNVSSIGGYTAGKTDITVTVNSGIYLWANSTSNYGLNLTGGTTGDTLTLVNNGYIMGQGGTPNVAGGAALNVGIGMNITINNAGYIGGGGGGGGGSGYGAGGGGAGGGAGGCSTSGWTHCQGCNGAGGGIGASGNSGGRYYRGGGCCISFLYLSGGGGRIMPGSGGGGGSSNGGVYGGGGGAGGGGNAGGRYGHLAGNGGSANAAGGNGRQCGGYIGGVAGGGGGGYGASGGTGICNGCNKGCTYTNYYPGAAGGKAINKNGKTVTFSAGCTRVYGAIS